MSKISFTGAIPAFTPIPEEIWRRAERDSMAEERLRLIRNGTIRPRRDLPPTTLYKTASGIWRRALGFFHPLKIGE